MSHLTDAPADKQVDCLAATQACLPAQPLQLDKDAVRSRIGVVFQHYNLFPHLSLLDNVTLLARKVHGTQRAEAEARGLELLERIGLAGQARSFPDRISGGQR